MSDFPPLIEGYLYDDASSSQTTPGIARASATVAGEKPQQQKFPIYSRVDPHDDARNQFLDGFQASAEANLIKHIESIHWIGKIVAKDNLQGLPNLGGVVNYIAYQKLFQVVYQDGSSETMGLEKVREGRYLAILLGDDRDDIMFDPEILAAWDKGVDVGRGAGLQGLEEEHMFDFARAIASPRGEVKEQKVVAIANASNSVAANWTTKRKAKKKPKAPKKPKSKQKDPSSYVALALHENKDDDYY